MNHVQKNKRYFDARTRIRLWRDNNNWWYRAKVSPMTIILCIGAEQIYFGVAQSHQ